MAVDHLLQSHDSDIVVYLVEEQSNPSTDFFVLPALTLRELKIIRCGFIDLPLAEELESALVIFVRYIPPGWLKLISKHRSKLCGLIFFMDDDVLDFSASAGMPLRYRFKLARLSARHKKWLKNNKAELWVSTPYLQQKYIQWQPRLVLPSPLVNSIDMRRVFYHGSASHETEILWLKPIMEQVLQRDNRITFEIIGGLDVYRQFRGLPRTTVVHPMKWPAYQAFLLMTGRHIGLAPLLDSAFNRARSYTKFFDITRCGAVGIYSAGSACAEVVKHGVNGVVVVQEQEAWIEAILNLAKDDSLRQRMLHSADEKMIELGNMALHSHPNILFSNIDEDKIS